MYVVVIDCYLLYMLWFLITICFIYIYGVVTDWSVCYGYRTVTLVTLGLAEDCTWVCACPASVTDIPTSVTQRPVSAG